jgi:hypothetical protein
LVLLFLIIFFLSTSLLTGMTGISMHVAVASDFSVAWQIFQRELLFFSLLIKLHTLICIGVSLPSYLCL